MYIFYINFLNLSFIFIHEFSYNYETELAAAIEEFNQALRGHDISISDVVSVESGLLPAWDFKAGAIQPLHELQPNSLQKTFHQKLL